MYNNSLIGSEKYFTSLFLANLGPSIGFAIAPFIQDVLPVPVKPLQPVLQFMCGGPIAMMLWSVKAFTRALPINLNHTRISVFVFLSGKIMFDNSNGLLSLVLNTRHIPCISNMPLHSLQFPCRTSYHKVCREKDCVWQSICGLLCQLWQGPQRSLAMVWKVNVDRTMNMICA